MLVNADCPSRSNTDITKMQDYTTNQIGLRVTLGESAEERKNHHVIPLPSLLPSPPSFFLASSRELHLGEEALLKVLDREGGRRRVGLKWRPRGRGKERWWPRGGRGGALGFAPLPLWPAAPLHLWAKMLWAGSPQPRLSKLCKNPPLNFC